MKTESTSQYQFEYTSTDPVSRSASGVSVDAAKSKYSELIRRLEEAKTESLSDGDYEMPSEASFRQAQSFAMSLSLYPFSLPLVMCLNDGGICFQWSTEQNGILTATLYGNNALVYVARFGPRERSTGTDEYADDSISESLLVWLKKYFMPISKQPWKSTSATMSH
jgi:hypothetical protein